MRVARRTCAAGAAALLTAALRVAGAELTEADAGRQPNIVLIVADDLGWNSVGYHGGPVRTPHIDRIGREGAFLERFYVSPMCSPTRAGLLTGRYPMRFGMARSVVRPWARYGLPPAETTLAEIVAEAGYRHRGVFGKWHLGHLDPKWHPLSQGFTDFEGQYNGAADYWTRERNGEIDWHINGEPERKEGYTTDLIAEAACGFIRQHAASGPFLCYVPFTAPHTPLQAPERYLVQYAHLDDDPADGRPSDLQALAAMIACMDDGIGTILDALDSAGVLGNTLIWFISDNGGVRHIPGVNDPLREGKLTVYEGGVRVPSVVWWPGMVEGGRKIAEPILNIDVVPTLMRAARVGKSGGAELDGRDVLDALTGRKASLPRDLYMFAGQSGLEKEQIAVISGDGWKLVVTGPDIRRPQGIRGPDRRVELFHLAEDPLETADVSDQEPNRVKELGDKLIVFRGSESGDSLPPMNMAPRGGAPRSAADRSTVSTGTT